MNEYLPRAGELRRLAVSLVFVEEDLMGEKSSSIAEVAGKDKQTAKSLHYRFGSCFDREQSAWGKILINT